MGYIFVVANKRNTTSCGLWQNFQNLDVHNLFIGYLSITGFLDLFEITKEGRIQAFSPFY